MKTGALLWISLIILTLSACQAESENIEEFTMGDRTIFSAGLIASERSILDKLPGASYYQIDLHISDDFLLLEGHEAVRYTNREDVPLDEIYFRLFTNVTGGETRVSNLKVDGKPVDPKYEFADTALRVTLPEALKPGDETTIQMDFRVDVALEMGGNYGLFGYFEDVLVLDEFYPAIVVYDDEGWNVEIPPESGDLTYYDASFYVVRVTAPKNLEMVASGIEVDSQTEEKDQTRTYVAGPARDFYIAASEEFKVISEKVGETTVNAYAISNRSDGAELALQFAVDSLENFNRRFGPYPYTEFDLVSTPLQALGIEYPGIVGISLDLYDVNAEVSGLPAPVILESVIAHEAAHQWFYNLVGNDQVDEPWLDEALAQYATYTYYVDMYGEANAVGYRNSWDDRWNRVDKADLPIGLPVADYADGMEYGALVYGRGPIVVSDIGDVMGAAPFASFLKDYVAVHRWGIATTESFKHLAEEHCQCDLTEQFEAWVYAR